MRLVKDFKFIMLLIVLIALLVGGGCGIVDEAPESPPAPSPGQINEEDATPKPDVQEAIASKGLLTVHFIDVGQGDACLVELPFGQTMLIDGGERTSFNTLKEYLQDQKVDRIDYLIATHPHADHIGGLIGILGEFEIGEVYMPRVSHNTKTFADLLEAIQNKGLKITAAKAGLDLEVGDGVIATFVSPKADGEYDNLNDYSAVLKLTHDQVSFLVTGDAEKKSEIEMAVGEIDLQAQVLKVGHHGSSTSTSQEFVKKVAPELAIISAGKDNSYGHPHTEVVERLEALGAEILRTDLLGTIIITSNGQEIIGISTPSNPIGGG